MNLPSLEPNSKGGIATIIYNKEITEGSLSRKDLQSKSIEELLHIHLFLSNEYKEFDDARLLAESKMKGMEAKMKRVKREFRRRGIL